MDETAEKVTLRVQDNTITLWCRPSACVCTCYENVNKSEICSDGPKGNKSSVLPWWKLKALKAARGHTEEKTMHLYYNVVII